jgi:hypothetical protein
MQSLEMQEALERLAEHDGGRRLLQLALRSIEAGDHELVSGCWTRKGDAGCLFQHAYWQGVSDGMFADDGRARAWVSGVAGAGAYHRVIDVIAAFDQHARAEYAVERRRFGPPELDRSAGASGWPRCSSRCSGAGGSAVLDPARADRLDHSAGLDLPAP